MQKRRDKMNGLKIQAQITSEKFQNWLEEMELKHGNNFIEEYIVRTAEINATIPYTLWKIKHAKEYLISKTLKGLGT